MARAKTLFRKRRDGRTFVLVLVCVLVCVLVLFNNTSAAGERLNPVKTGRSCKALRSMARLYMAYGDYTKAQLFAEQALTLAKTRNVSDAELCSCLLDLAYLYNNQNKLADAEEMCKLGLKLQKKVYYEDHPYVAYTLRTLSSIYQGQGRYRQARYRMSFIFPSLQNPVCLSFDQIA